MLQQFPDTTIRKAGEMMGVDLRGMLTHMLPLLWKFALFLADDERDAEYLVEHACLRAIEFHHQLRSDRVPFAWTFFIVQATWIDEIRTRKVRNRPSIIFVGADRETREDPMTGPTNDGWNAEVISAVLNLPEAQMVAIFLVEVEGMSRQQAADLLDVSIDTLMNRLSLARQTLGAQFIARQHCDFAFK